MKKICILTATRAEYGLLKPIILKLKEIHKIDVRVVATGAHLSPEFGLTYKEIERDGINIDEKIEILLSADTPSAISKSMGLAMISFGDYFEKINPDMLVVLGDRYETIAVCCAAMNQRIPISHIYGGEVTEGVIDEAIRHAITKMSYLHFTSTDKYRNRVIQLGEEPDRVFNVGSIGVENIKNLKLMSKNELEQSLKITLEKPYAVVTFHPVTLENESSAKQIEELLQAISMHNELNFIFTKSNSDTNSRIINQMIDNYVMEHTNCKAFTSLGATKYLSVVKYSSMVIGNSSSGIVEVPTLKIPTINIGDRQKGRIQTHSIINCEPNTDSIHNAMIKAKTPEFLEIIKTVNNPYEKENTSKMICDNIIYYIENGKINLKKKFYDLHYTE